jgi:hypothetical protein
MLGVIKPQRPVKLSAQICASMDDTVDALYSNDQVPT